MRDHSGALRGRGVAEVAWVGSLGVAALLAAVAAGTVPTTIRDFIQGGTQPNSIPFPLVSAGASCVHCHGDYDDEHEPYRPWAASLMGQAARDPVFHACMTIANQDAAFAGEFCLRCHTPQGWLEGRSTPPDGSMLMGADWEGVACSVCHRMVDPVYHPGASPPEDMAILAGLPRPPVNAGNGSYIMDPEDRRRGPRVITPQATYHEWLRSPFHRDSSMCATCHEVSNPVYSRQPDGSYRLNQLDAPHPTGNRYDQFPIERTYSEWLHSSFAQGPIDMGGRFGGTNPLVGSCQDCHMPRGTGTGCFPDLDPPVRKDLAQHHFPGGNTWVLRAVHSLYPHWETDLTDALVDAAVARTESFLRAASDLELTAGLGRLRVRVINQTGHKLPTGYPEGRRMWVNVRFHDAQGAIVSERGAYDWGTATLSTGDTKVYEAKIGLDAHAAGLTGKPAGPGFHFAINNTWFLDNRIPPRGFTNAAFAGVQAAPVAYAYADGQYWDDTLYEIPPGAASARVRVYFQTTSREYIEFLRDANTTNNTGQVAYAQWAAHGKGAPALMDDGQITLPECPADLNGDGAVDFNDFLEFLNLFNAEDPIADVNMDGAVDFNDFLEFLNLYNAGC
ncbi:MAG: hypothetical protein FJ255_08380 [Phycisphaerae bacterium]|nr:hypothetical protein [Phycisphaerae bacterium]